MRTRLGPDSAAEQVLREAAVSIVRLAPRCAQGVRVKSFAVGADGCTAVAVLFDSSVTVWDLATGSPRAVLQVSLGAA